MKMEKEIKLAHYCEACQREHNLPQCANFLFNSKCQVCGKPFTTIFFSGGCCVINPKAAT
jgi:hypothetical protein